ncbi:MAG: DNA polymerase/3'-5' exonuclease PolX [Methanomicrobiaceae archaeon]|nr:DNA polymerase/3'-5' exonuclease PolX [Methanomicrobiaceae archaeon]
MALSNRQIADTIRHMGQLLEIQGEENFKVRAYARAAETILRQQEPLSEKTAAEMSRLPGIGKNIAAKIVELHETGTIGEYKHLRESIPAGVVELLELDGVGPKTVHKLWKKFGIVHVDALEAAARGHRLRSMRGFGEKKEAEILRSIARHRQQSGRMRRDQAEEVIDSVTAVLPPDSYIVAGSFRRGKSTVGDIDIVSIAPAASVNRLLFTVADEVIDEGERRTSIRVGTRRVDVRFTDRAHFGSMLVYLTGSKQFNIRLRGIAQDQGCKLNEYGIEHLQTGEQFAFVNEEAMFHHLGMDPVPPELREDTGEIERAQAHNLPSLVERGQIRGDLHVHSSWSDGVLDITDLARIGEQRGYEYILITDHSASLGVAGGLDEHAIRRQVHEIELANRNGGCHLLAGIEVDILSDGRLGLPDRVLQDLDVVVASIHSGFKQEEDVMTRRVIAALQNEHVDILGHPTGRLLGKRPAVDIDMGRIIDAAAETGTAMEINASPHRLDIDDTHVRQAKEHGVRMAISTDAHRTEDFASMHHGLAVARRGWCEKNDILNTKPIHELLEFMQ